ncbi:hypothetical protein H0H87_012990 [Tephrocybe sp. NHM501043]|nr:hypothetical protein H0H87_012990 [Tephrocybe sp. NHM501043]
MTTKEQAFCLQLAKDVAAREAAQGINMLFMPEASQQWAKAAHKGTEYGIATTKAYNILLWLPSNLLEKEIKVVLELLQYKWKLGEGQANDSLEEIRHILSLQSYLYKYKDHYSRGIKANMWSSSIIEKATQTLKRAEDQYRAAYAAMLLLAPAVDLPWNPAFCLLLTSDVCSLTEGLIGDLEGKYTISWIWLCYPSIEHRNKTQGSMTVHIPSQQWG